MSGSTQTAEPEVRPCTFNLQAFSRSTRDHCTRPPLAGTEVTCIPREGGFTKSFHVASLAAGILFLLSDEAREIKVADRDSDGRWAIRLARITGGGKLTFGIEVIAADKTIEQGDLRYEEIINRLLERLPIQPAAAEQQPITFSPTEPPELHRDPVG